jgi:hypothetical protein
MNPHSTPGSLFLTPRAPNGRRLPARARRHHHMRASEDADISPREFLDRTDVPRSLSGQITPERAVSAIMNQTGGIPRYDVKPRQETPGGARETKAPDVPQSRPGPAGPGIVPAPQNSPRFDQAVGIGEQMREMPWWIHPPVKPYSFHSHGETGFGLQGSFPLGKKPKP